MTDPQRLRIELPELTLVALAWGPDDGPLALCLHGFPDTAWTWRHLGPALAERGWRVVAPFSRGYAPSDLAPDGQYPVGALMRDALDTHTALGGDARAVLIGHDWGGITAYGVAAFEPERFARIVTLAVPPLPAVLGAAWTPLPRLRLLAELSVRSWYAQVAQLPLLGEAVLRRSARRLWTTWSPGYDPTEDLAHLAESLDSTARWSAALGYYRAALQPASGLRGYAAEQRRAYADPRLPTLALHGSQDGVAPPELASRTGRHLSEGSSSSVLPGVGHFLHLEDPARVNDLIARFLEPEVPSLPAPP